MRLFAAAAIAGLSMLSCTNVAYYEKKTLDRRIMVIDDNELDATYQNKVYATRESSGGRPGHAAGGGCGCGN